MDSYQFSNSDMNSSKIKDAISFQKKFLLIGMKCECNTWKFFFFEKMRDDVNPRTFKTIPQRTAVSISQGNGKAGRTKY